MAGALPRSSFGLIKYPGTVAPAPLSKWNFSTMHSPRSSVESVSTWGRLGRGGNLPSSSHSCVRTCWRCSSHAALVAGTANGQAISDFASQRAASVWFVWAIRAAGATHSSAPSHSAPLLQKFRLISLTGNREPDYETHAAPAAGKFNAGRIDTTPSRP